MTVFVPVLFKSVKRKKERKAKLVIPRFCHEFLFLEPVAQQLIGIVASSLQEGIWWEAFLEYYAPCWSL